MFTHIHSDVACLRMLAAVDITGEQQHTPPHPRAAGRYITYTSFPDSSKIQGDTAIVQQPHHGVLGLALYNSKGQFDLCLAAIIVIDMPER